MSARGLEPQACKIHPMYISSQSTYANSTPSVFPDDRKVRLHCKTQAPPCWVVSDTKCLGGSLATAAAEALRCSGPRTLRLDGDRFASSTPFLVHDAASRSRHLPGAAPRKEVTRTASRLPEPDPSVWRSLSLSRSPSRTNSSFSATSGCLLSRSAETSVGP